MIHNVCITHRIRQIEHYSNQASVSLYSKIFHKQTTKKKRRISILNHPESDHPNWVSFNTQWIIKSDVN